MINFSLPQVAAFIAVAEAGSFRAAAERLHLSQPAVSARVRQLEDHLQVHLFNRTTRSVSLTPAGERLLHASARALGELEHLADELREEAGLARGRIAVAAIPSIAGTILPPAMAAFRAAHPGVTVELVEVLTRRTFEAVEQGIAALGLMSGPMPRDPFDFEPLFDDPCVAVVAAGRVARTVALVLWAGCLVGAAALTVRVLADPSGVLGPVAASRVGRTGTVEATASASAWPWVALLGVLLAALALGAALVGRRRWGAPSRRYDAPGATEGHVAGSRGERVTSAWDDLSAGRDPTDVGEDRPT